MSTCGRCCTPLNSSARCSSSVDSRSSSTSSKALRVGAAQQSFTVGRRTVGQQVADDRRHAPGAARRSTRPRVAQLGDRLDHVEVVGRGQEREEVLRVPGEDRRVRGGGLAGQDGRDGGDGEGARGRVARVPGAVLGEPGEVREPDRVDLTRLVEEGGGGQLVEHEEEHRRRVARRGGGDGGGGRSVTSSPAGEANRKAATASSGSTEV